MRTQKNILLNTLFNLLTLIYPLVMAPFTSRVLGAEKLGIYYYVYAIATYFTLFALLGVNNYGNRSVSMVRDDKEKLNATFNSIFLMQLITAMFTTAVYFLFTFGVVKENKTIFFIQSLFVVSEMFNINWLFLGLEKFMLPIIRNTLVKIVSLVLIILLVKTPDDLPLFTLIMSASFLFSQLGMWVNLRKYVKFKLPRLSACIPHIKPNIMLFLPAMAISLFVHMDKVMLGIFSNMRQVGYYENAEKIARVIPVSIINAFNTVMLPKMSNMAAKSETAKAKEYITKSMQVMMICACALSFGIAAVAMEFAPFFLGKEFAHIGILVILLTPSVLASSWNSVIRTQYLIPNMKEKIYLGSAIAGAVVNLIVNYLLIGTYGALGAIIGTLFAYFAVVIYQTVAVRKELPVTLFLTQTVPYLLIGLVMFVAVRVVAHFSSATGWVLIFAEITTGVLVFISLVFGYMYITQDELLQSLSKIKWFRFLEKRPKQ